MGRHACDDGPHDLRPTPYRAALYRAGSSSSRFTSHCACWKKMLPNETTPHEGHGKPELWWPKASERIGQVQNVEPAQDDRWGELPSLMYDTVLVKCAHAAPSLCGDTLTIHRTIKKSIFEVQKHHQSHQKSSTIDFEKNQVFRFFTFFSCFFYFFSQKTQSLPRNHLTRSADLQTRNSRTCLNSDCNQWTAGFERFGK